MQTAQMTQPSLFQPAAAPSPAAEATTHNVENLILYADNTSALYEQKKAIYLAFQPTGSREGDIDSLTRLFAPFLRETIRLYKDEVKESPGIASEQERQAFCRSYAKDYYSYDIRQLIELNRAPDATAPTIAGQAATVQNGSTRKVDPSILALLSRARAEGTSIYINTGSLDRKTYEQVDAIMKKMGGKWDKRQRAHVFPFDPAEKLDLLLMAGVVEIPENYGHFPTPPQFAQGTIIPLADLKPGMKLFEPEAGTGNLADAAAAIVGTQNVICCELQEKNQQLLRDKGYHVIPGDFLSLPPDPVYPRIIMNPPFAHFQDIAHVTHALKFLQPQGRLVSIMSGGITFREDRRTKEFRDLIQTLGGDITENPVRTFKESGTDCQTVTVTIQT